MGRQESDVRDWPVAALDSVVDPASGTDIDSVLAAATRDLAWEENRMAVLLARGMSAECSIGNSEILGAQASSKLAEFSLEHRRGV